MSAPVVTSELIDTAVRLVLALLPQQEVVQPEEVAQACKYVDAMLADMPGGSPGIVAIRREVESRVVVWQESSKSLQSDEDHVPWLTAAKATGKWEFWERYRRYLADVEKLARQVIWRVDETTDSIISKLEDPHRLGQWDRRGLVVGEVQSGKTANYTGLICKAADAGYKLIVILTGMHNSLRSQTQLRVDLGVLGRDSQFQQRTDLGDQQSSRIGVGLLPGVPQLKVATLTNSAERGDFRRQVAVNMNLPIGDYPVVLVIKKHRSIIDNVRKWVTEVEGQLDGGHRVVRAEAALPLLVIDDEADNASINTGAITDPDEEPTKINAAIRTLLNSFEQSGYVGYTATPYANIYAGSDVDHEDFGQDIFPRSFIESLRAPSNYFGATRVFGLRSIDGSEEGVEPLPILRAVMDHDAWLPDGHRKDALPGDVPDSLLTALKSFVLVCAARRARGQAIQHNSMLVHATRFQDVQRRVLEQLKDELQFLRDRVRQEGTRHDAAVWTELGDLWRSDFVATTAQFDDDEIVQVTWDQVRDEVFPALEKIQCRSINGASKDALDYWENGAHGLSVIAVGGNKLSRGLTLEGLSVSYYLRTSKMYDTLLQMGRWFGYRPGYEDLCRLYTTELLNSAYREITAATEELRLDLEEMAVQGLTPKEYGLRVRSSVNGLIVTSPTKMRRGEKVKLSYSGDINETTTFDLSATTLDSNWRLLDSFVRKLDAHGDSDANGNSGSRLWRNVPSELVTSGFFDGYVADRMAQRVKPEFLAKYIRGCAAAGELGNWSVMLVSVSSDARATVGHSDLGLVTRANRSESKSRYVIRRVLSPADESVDMSIEQKTVALAALRNRRRDEFEKRGELHLLEQKVAEPSGPELRRQRRPDQALLVLYPLARPLADLGNDVVGWAVSFPFSGQEVELGAEYVVNEIWRADLSATDDE